MVQMAMGLNNARRRLQGRFFGSGRRYMGRSSSREGDQPQTPALGQRKTAEILWKEFFSDPSQWWDHRYEKAHSRYPDFKHKTTKEALWLNGNFKPPWVEEKLAAMAPGAVQVNLFTWNCVLVKHAKNGQPQKTLELFLQMEQQGVVPDRFTFVPVLNACASLRALEEGKRIHTRVIQSHCESNLYVSNSLINMYSKCGSLEDAWRVFNNMSARDVVSWNSMISGCVKNGQGSQALKLFARMQGLVIEPDTLTFVAVLNACAMLRSLEGGRRIHEMLVARGFESNTYVGTSLVDMYVECGSMSDACQVFNEMPARNVVSWNVMILGHVKCSEGEKALELFEHMQQEGIEPDHATFVGVLNACASMGDLEEGRFVHHHINQTGFEADFFVASSLVDMYVKCGSIDDARRVFNTMRTRDVVACKTVILGHVKTGQGEQALELYKELRLQGMVPDAVTFGGLLNACASLGALDDGRSIHQHVIQTGCETDLFVGGSLVDMYAKCGSMDDACSVFKMIPKRNVVTWNAMILGYLKCGLPQKSLDLFRRMKQEGIKPIPLTFVCALNACASLRALAEGRLVHEEIICKRLSSITLDSSLVNMYAKCGSIDDARGVFENMPTRDVDSWNTLIMGLVKCGRGSEALELHQTMQREGVEPNSATFVGVLNACGTLGALEQGRAIHGQITQTGFESDINVGSSLVDMYARCGSIDDAWKVFNKLPSQDVVCWNAMIHGYVKCGQGQDALELSRQMRRVGVEPVPITFVGMLKACAATGALEEGKHVHELIIQSESECNVYVGSSLVDMYAKCGSIEDAWRAFNRLPAHDLVSWNALILGYVNCGQGQKVWELYRQMVEEGVVPDGSIFVSVLNACTRSLALEDGRRVHEHIIQAGYDSDISVCGSLVEVFSKCGSMEEAQKVFKSMPSRNITSWNAMLRGHAMHGQAKEALEHFEWMFREGVQLNAATFDYLLSACGSAGLVEEGLRFFKSMSSVHGVSVTTEHCGHIVSLLVTAGRLREAEDVMEKMHCEPDVSIWMNVRDVCQIQGDHGMEKRVSNRILEVEDSNCF